MFLTQGPPGPVGRTPWIPCIKYSSHRCGNVDPPVAVRASALFAEGLGWQEWNIELNKYTKRAPEVISCLFDKLFLKFQTFSVKYLLKIKSTPKVFKPVTDSRSVGSILNPLAEKFSGDARKKGKGAKTGISRFVGLLFVAIWFAIKGSHMTKVVWLPNETYYSYCEFMCQILPTVSHPNQFKSLVNDLQDFANGMQFWWVEGSIDLLLV